MKEKIIEIIRECCALTEDNITPDTELKDLSLDSLSFVEFIVKLESEFNIEFEDEQLNIRDYATVRDIITAVESLGAACEKKD
jgi:acyl carrier protein